MTSAVQEHPLTAVASHMAAQEVSLPLMASANVSQDIDNSTINSSSGNDKAMQLTAVAV
jgi:hypothetical protein